MLGLFNRSGTDRTVVLDISKAFRRLRESSLLQKLRFYGVSGRVFDLNSSFLCNRQLRVILQRNLSERCPVNTVVTEGFILDSTLFLIYNNNPDDFTCDIANCADETTLYTLNMNGFHNL